MAEAVGFEPTVEFPPRSVSNRVLSASQPRLRRVPFNGGQARGQAERQDFFKSAPSAPMSTKVRAGANTSSRKSVRAALLVVALVQAYIEAMRLPFHQLVSVVSRLWVLAFVVAIVLLPFAGPVHAQLPAKPATVGTLAHSACLVEKDLACQHIGDDRCLTHCAGWFGPLAVSEPVPRAVLLPQGAMPDGPLRLIGTSRAPVPRPPDSASFL